MDPAITEARGLVPTNPAAPRSAAIASVFSMLLVALIYLRWQGRVWWCACGRWNPVSLDTWSSHNSQHLIDAYSLSHILHGVIFFGLLWLTRKWIGLPWRFVISMAIEIAWELCENSPLIINRYREGTVSLGYTGDSIANSFGDIGSFAVGFWIAGRLGLWRSILGLVMIETLMLWWIRDNLTLNVLMLLWPIDAVRKWQSGG